MAILDKLFTVIVTITLTVIIIGVIGVGIAFWLMSIQM